MMRVGDIERGTNETELRVRIDLEGSGTLTGETPIGFFTHMLAAFAAHGLFDLELAVRRADLIVDGHHLVEDMGICLGQALKKALGDKRGITRVGESSVPMDEALAHVVLDISARPYLVWDVPLRAPSVGAFDTELAVEFYRALAQNAGITLHVRAYGDNAHHILEAISKAFGRALRMAVRIDPRVQGVPSTKGSLE